MAGWFVIAKNMIEEIRSNERTDDWMLHDVVVRTLYELSHYSGLKEPDSMIWVDSRVTVCFGEKRFEILGDGTYIADGKRIDTTQKLWKWLTDKGVVASQPKEPDGGGGSLPSNPAKGNEVKSNGGRVDKVRWKHPPKRKGR